MTTRDDAPDVRQRRARAHPRRTTGDPTFHPSSTMREPTRERRPGPAERRYRFTVFTSTRNRAHTLERPFSSLMAQTFRDFEWLIVDNGSTDGTRELVERFQAEADFPIRYYWQDDAGKHGSMNRAVRLAHGELFLTLDSDDSCVDNALERLLFHWESIPERVRGGYSGVTVNCRDEHGRTLGTPFPHDPTDSDSREIRYRYKVRGEKWGFQRTDVMREHPFPETPGYRGLIPSGTVWSAIGRRYRTRYVNEALHVWWQDQVVSLSRPIDPLDDALGGMIETRTILDDDIVFFRYAPWPFMLKAIKYVRCSFHCRVGVSGQWSALSDGRARALWFAALPGGWLAYRLERAGLTRQVRRFRQLLG
jgi:glycosyltransferase involved in cell wall biosynthesis